MGKSLNALAAPLALGLLGIGASQINNAFDAIFARYAEAEGPAYLWYSIRVQQLPIGLFGVALSGALLPPLARAAKALDAERYNTFLDFALKKTYILIIPLSWTLFVLSAPTINLLYGRGDFVAESIEGTSLCLMGYGIGLVPAILILILAPSFYARNDYKTPAKASLLSVTINIVLNTLFVGILKYGAASVALAASIAAIANATYLNKKAQGLLGQSLPFPYSTLIKALFVGFIASAAVIVTEYAYFGKSAFFAILMNQHFPYPTTFFMQVSHLGVDALAFTAVALVVGWQLGLIKELFENKNV